MKPSLTIIVATAATAVSLVQTAPIPATPVTATSIYSRALASSTIESSGPSEPRDDGTSSSREKLVARTSISNLDEMSKALGSFSPKLTADEFDASKGFDPIFRPISTKASDFDRAVGSQLTNEQHVKLANHADPVYHPQAAFVSFDRAVGAPLTPAQRIQNIVPGYEPIKQKQIALYDTIVQYGAKAGMKTVRNAKGHLMYDLSSASPISVRMPSQTHPKELYSLKLGSIDSVAPKRQ